MDLSVFDEVAELVLAMAPGDVHVRAHRRGVKVWFDSKEVPREHYEAQLLSRRYVDGSEGMALEIGFHAEYKTELENVEVIDRLLASEMVWRAEIGDEAIVDVFFGADNWRRVSEAWIEPDLDDPEITFEVASRLVDYVTVLEPARK